MGKPDKSKMINGKWFWLLGIDVGSCGRQPHFHWEKRAQLTPPPPPLDLRLDYPLQVPRRSLFPIPAIRGPDRA